MTKGRDYYIYMFIDEQMAFASVFKNLLVVLLLYIFVAASVFAFRRRSNAQLLKIQMMQEEACKQKLLQEAQRADMANNAKTEFLQRMSHDIRTPINGIRGMIEVADYYKDDLKKHLLFLFYAFFVLLDNTLFDTCFVVSYSLLLWVFLLLFLIQI